MSETQPESPKRWRLLLTLGGGVLILLLLCGAIWALNSRSSFEGRIAAIRAAGDPASIADLAPRPIPDYQNAAAQLAAIAPRLEGFAHEHGAFYKTPLGKAYEAAQDRGEPPSADQIAAIRAILENYPDVDAALAKAAACDQYASRADFSLDYDKFLAAEMSTLTNVRTATRLVCWRMESLTAAGNADEAIELGIRVLRLARLYESEPGFVNLLVSIALRATVTPELYDALAAGPVSAEMHAKLDQELARHDGLDYMKASLKSERAISISAMASMSGTGLKAKLAAFALHSQFQGVLDFYDRALPIIDKPCYAQVHSSFQAAVAQSPIAFGGLAQTLLPAVNATYEAANRDLAVLRSLRIFNALRQFAEEHGREASGLDDLKLPAAITIDPFSGDRLRLKLTPEGWIVYTVFRNGIDDGGNLGSQLDWGIGPPASRRESQPAVENNPSP